jgi:hypothetical protein
VRPPARKSHPNVQADFGLWRLCRCGDRYHNGMALPPLLPAWKS